MALIHQLASSGEDEKDKEGNIEIEIGYSQVVPRLGAFSPPKSGAISLSREQQLLNPSSYESNNKSFLSREVSTHSKPKVKRVFDEATI